MSHNTSRSTITLSILVGAAIVLFLAFRFLSPAGEQEMADDAAGSGPIVLAAASMHDALEDAADAWQAKGHARPVLSFAASSALARQIQAGAPADLFISANEEWMDTLERDGLLQDGSRASLVTNRLVLIAQSGSQIALEPAPGFDLAGALGDGRLAVAETDSVPAGRYAKAALERLGIWGDVKDRLAPAENVRAALQLVARGAAPLGITYATDALSEPQVRIVGTFPDDSHPPIRYPVAVAKASSHGEAAAFEEFLLSAEAAAIFAHHGFGPAG